MPVISLVPSARKLFLAVAIAASCSFGPSASAIEPVQKVVSPGGIEALLIESHEVKLISMKIGFKGGASQDPADKPGVADMVSFMFNEGAGDLATPELMRRLAVLGASFAGTAWMESIDITVNTPSVNRDETFALLKLAMNSPRYDN